MKTKIIGLLVILAAVGGVVAYKVAAQNPDSTAAAPTNAASPRVLLFADLSEADDDCGCGRIIRSVREVATRGVATRENDDELGRKYKVTTNTTVVILDGEGREEARYEGESKDTVAKIRAHLDKLQAGSR